MIDITSMYLRNLIKRGLEGDKIYSAEIAHLPKLIDSVYGDDNGQFDIDDIDDIVTNVISEATDKVSDIWDFITSII